MVFTRAALVSFTGLALAGCPGSGAQDITPSPRRSVGTAGTTGAEPLRAVVLVVVDQLPAWSFRAKQPLFRHGFATLVRQGRYFRKMIFPYAATLTGAGHAALATGAPPARSGVPGNEWYDRKLGKQRNCVEDPRYPLWSVARDRAASERGCSPFALRAETVADVLRAQRPEAKVVTASLKDRAAIFTGGQRPHLALWYDAPQAAFTSSSFYGKAPPRWLRAHARRHAVSRHFGYVWKPLDPGLLARVAGADQGPGEQQRYDLGAVFPHHLGKTKQPASTIKETPIADELLLDLALAAFDAEQLGRDDTADLFVISFSTPDYVGHRWGQLSWEMHDELMRLDRLLARLIGALDSRVGAGRWALLLTSDHGATKMIERAWAEGKRHARRVEPKAIHRVAEAAAAKVFGSGDWIVSPVRGPTLYLTAAALAQPAPKRSKALGGIAEAVAALPGLATARRTDRLIGRCDQRGEPEATYCRALTPGVSGEIFFHAAPDCMIYGGERKPVTHGSPNPDDQTVPALLFAPGRIAPGVEPEAVSALQVAPTLAKLLGIRAPKQARAKPLY